MSKFTCKIANDYVYINYDQYEGKILCSDVGIDEKSIAAFIELLNNKGLVNIEEGMHMLSIELPFGFTTKKISIKLLPVNSHLAELDDLKKEMMAVKKQNIKMEGLIAKLNLITGDLYRIRVWYNFEHCAMEKYDVNNYMFVSSRFTGNSPFSVFNKTLYECKGIINKLVVNKDGFYMYYKSFQHTYNQFTDIRYYEKRRELEEHLFPNDEYVIDYIQKNKMYSLCNKLPKERYDSAEFRIVEYQY